MKYLVDLEKKEIVYHKDMPGGHIIALKRIFEKQGYQLRKVELLSSPEELKDQMRKEITDEILAKFGGPIVKGGFGTGGTVHTTGGTLSGGFVSSTTSNKSYPVTPSNSFLSGHDPYDSSAQQLGSLSSPGLYMGTASFNHGAKKKKSTEKSSTPKYSSDGIGSERHKEDMQDTPSGHVPKYFNYQHQQAMKDELDRQVMDEVRAAKSDVTIMQQVGELKAQFSRMLSKKKK